MKVMIIEDEERFLDLLEDLLRREGYSTYKCMTIEEAGLAISAEKFVPEVVVLDRMLQENDALRLLPSIKKHFPDSRVLVLSAVNTSLEKAAALDQGADDYMTKPFASVEFLARLRALGRRRGARPSESQVKLGNLVVDTTGRFVRVGDQKINLSNKEFLVLNVLAERPGKVFRKPELLEIVWEVNSNTESNVVEATINNLRRKLEEAGAGIFIRNMRNVGYWIEN